MQLLDAFGLAPSCAYSSTDPFVPIGRNVIPYDLNWIKESRVTTERVEMLHKWGVSSLVHFSIASHSLDPSAQHHPRDTEPDRQNRTNADYFKSKKSLLHWNQIYGHSRDHQRRHHAVGNASLSLSFPGLPQGFFTSFRPLPTRAYTYGIEVGRAANSLTDTKS